MTSASEIDLGDVHVDAYSTREEWLASRAAPDTIGASEAAMALGVSPYGTSWALWERKRAPKKEQHGQVLQRGHRWEPAVLAEYADESGYRVMTPPEALGRAQDSLIVLSNPRLPWLRESPDAFALDAQQLGQVEAKTAMRAHEWAPEQGVVIESWDDDYAELLPPHYAIQGYVQLIVTGLPWNDLCALVPRGGWLGVRWVRLMRDAQTQDEIEAALTEWRERHLVAGEAPPIDGSDACNRYLADRSPKWKSRPERVATAEEVAVMVELARIRQSTKTGKARADEIRNQLLESAEGYRLRIPGGGIKAPYGQPQPSAGRVTVDVAGLRSEAPDLVAKHERQGAPFASFNLYRFDQMKEA